MGGVTAIEPLDGSRQVLRAFYRDILRIRLIEEAIADRYVEQEMRCPVHLSIGQEATAVGLCHALRPSDRLFSSHRCHAHYLAKGGDLKAMLAEVYGKAAGCVGGRGGSMHLQDHQAGIMASVPIVGGSIPLAVGTALADSLDGNGRVSVACFGDAAAEEGVFHEACNFAQLRQLPVLFFLENNGYSVYSSLDSRQPKRPLAYLARAHDMAVISGDGNDVCAVNHACAEAAERARAGMGPTLLVFDTYRWREHCGPNYDDHLKYRPEGELTAWQGKDPLALLRAKLLDAGILTSDVEDGLSADIRREIEVAFEYAREAPLPHPAQAALHVYA